MRFNHKPAVWSDFDSREPGPRVIHDYAFLLMTLPINRLLGTESGSSNPASSTCMESPLMLNTMRERMPGANVPLPYGGRVTGSNSLVYEGKVCRTRNTRDT